MSAAAFRRRTEVDVTASAAARIIDSGMLPKTPEVIQRVARLLSIEVADIRESWTTGYREPQPAAVEGQEAPVAQPSQQQGNADRHELNIRKGLGSTSARVKKLAQRCRTLLEELHAAVEGDAERAAAQAEVERLERALKAARQRARGVRSSPATDQQAAPAPVRTGPSRSAVREWAQTHGIPVSEKGNVASEVVEMYLAAHPEAGE